MQTTRQKYIKAISEKLIKIKTKMQTFNDIVRISSEMKFPIFKIQRLIREISFNDIHENEYTQPLKIPVKEVPREKFTEECPNYIVYSYYHSLEDKFELSDGFTKFIIAVDDELGENRFDALLRFLTMETGPLAFVSIKQRNNFVKIPFKIMSITTQLAFALGLILNEQDGVLDPRFVNYICDEEFLKRNVQELSGDQFIDNDFIKYDPLVEELLIRGGVEMNPGPGLKFPKLNLNISLMDCGKYMIRFASGFQIMLPHDAVKFADNFVILEVEDNTKDRILESLRGRSGGFKYFDKEQLQDHYSSHINFIPNKRIVIKASNKIMMQLHMQYPLIDSEGVFQKVENFNFIPREILRVKLGTKWCMAPQVTSEKYKYALTSIKNQEMTKTQLVEYASMLSTLQLFYVKTEFDFNQVIKTYLDLYQINVEHVRKITRTKIDREEAIQLLKSLQLITVPIAGCETLKTKDYLKVVFPVPEKINFSTILEYEREEYMYDVDRAQLIKDFMAGKTRARRPDGVKIKFDFQDTIPRISNYLSHGVAELNQYESFVKELVKKRLIVSDFQTAIIMALEIITDYNLFKEIIKHFSGKYYTYLGFANLRSMLTKNFIPSDKDPDTITNAELTIEDYHQEISIARRMQLEFQQFLKDMNKSTNKNVFNTFQNVKDIFIFRNSKISEVNESYFSTVKRKYAEMRDALAALYDSGKTMKEVNELWASKKDSIINTLNLTEGSPAYAMFNQVDFSSFSDSLASSKMVINTLFEESIKKLAKYFGVEIKQTFPATTALLYYLIWKNTDNTILQYMLLIDILTTIGIVDVVVAALRTAGMLISKFWDKIVTSALDPKDLEKILTTLENRTSSDLNKAQGKLQNVPEPKVVEEDISTWEKIMTAVNSSNTALIGLVTIAIASAFKLSTKDYSYDIIGKDVVSTMKNLSIVGGGLLTIPKVYQMLISAVKWVIDEIKGLIFKNHKTRHQINVEAVEWSKKSMLFMTDSCVKAFQKSPQLCMHWLMLKDECVRLMKRTHDMSKDIRIKFSQDAKKFMDREQKVVVALSFMFNQDEIFHVQFCSAPGLGKTDLSHAIMKSLSDIGKTGQLDRAETVSGHLKRALVIDAITSQTLVLDKYSYNENLKFMDGYANQEILFGDDLNLFKTTEPEKITQQIYICSGNMVLANMADISEKGRPITSKIFVSNTNVMFPKVDGMLEPSALWRRRVLVSVEPCPGLQKIINKKKSTALDECIRIYCEENHVDRSSSEHLIFNVMVPTEETNPTVEKVGGVPLKNLSVGDLKSYLSARYRTHMASEWNRNVSKDPMLAKLKLYYDALSSRQLWPLDFNENDLMEKGEELIIKYFDNLSKKNLEEALKSSKFSQEEREVAMARLENRKNGMLEIFKTYNDTASVDDLILAAPVNRQLVPYKLQKKREDGKYIYSMIGSQQFHPYLDKDIDWGHVSIQESCVSKITSKNIIYTSSIELNEHDEQVVLGALLNLDSISFFHRDAWLAKKQKKYREMPFRTRFLQELKYIATQSADSGLALSKWLYKKVMKYAGEPLLSGVMIMFGLMGLFFTASIVGQLLVPQEVSYNSGKPRSTIIPGVSRPGARNVSMEQGQIKSISRSCFKAQVGDSVFQLLSYSGNIFIAPSHAFDNIKFPNKVKISDPSTSPIIKEFDLMKKQIKEIPDTDMVLINLPKMRPSKTLRHKWVTESELADNLINLRATEASIFTVKERSFNLQTFESDNRYISYQGPSILYKPADGRAHGRHKLDVLAIQLQTVPGDSGSMVIHHNNCLNSSVLGIVHQSEVAMGITYIAIAPRERIDKVYDQFDFEDKICVTLSEAPELEHHPLKPVFKYGQVIKESSFRNQSVDTNLGFKRTPIFSAFETEVQPAGQVYDDPRFPSNSRHFLEVSLNKSAGVQQAILTNEQDKFAYNYLKSIYLKWVPNVTLARVLNTAQAITGIRMKGSTSIDVTTCAGLPYKEQKGVVGKTPFITFDQEQSSWRIQQFVYDEVDRFESSYKQGFVPQNFKVEFRKHELVGQNKIDNPKTRTVGMGNFIQQIVYMKLFKDFHTITKNVWFEGKSCPFAVGLNPEVHWDQVAKHLKYLDYVIDFDVKAWEEKMNQSIMYLTTKVRLDILKQSMISQGLQWTKDYEKIALSLVVDYIHTDVVFEDIVYQKNAGLLSGHPGTFMENSEVHEIILGVACYEVLKKHAPHYANTEFIMEHVRSVKAADDILIAISPLAREYITADRLVAAYGKLGYEVTAPDKTPIVTAKTINEVQFLKNGFRKELDKYLVYPNESQINQLLTWIRTKTSNTTEEQLRINFGTAMRFAYWRGEEYYERMRERLNFVCSQVKVDFMWSSSYEEMSALIRRQEEDEKNQFSVKYNPQRTDEIFMEEDFYIKLF